MFFHLLQLLPSQVDALEKLDPQTVANGLQKQGGWYLSAILLLLCLWLGRKVFTTQEKSHTRSDEQTSLFTKHLDKGDEEVKELLVMSTTTMAEVGTSITIMSSEMRDVKDEMRRSMGELKTEVEKCKK